jgi:hypothetical protein
LKQRKNKKQGVALCCTLRFFYYFVVKLPVEISFRDDIIEGEQSNKEIVQATKVDMDLIRSLEYDRILNDNDWFNINIQTKAANQELRCNTVSGNRMVKNERFCYQVNSRYDK